MSQSPAESPSHSACASTVCPITCTIAITTATPGDGPSLRRATSLPAVDGQGGYPQGFSQGGFSQLGGSGLRGLLDDMGDRVRRRAEPRLGVALAGVGVLMIVTGLFV